MSLKTLNLFKSLRFDGKNVLCRLMGTSKSQKTSLYDFHIANNGKMVNFAGYLLPVQYADLGLPASHIHTRKSASVFDVSHMLQTYITGHDAIKCFESICTADIQGLPDGSGTLTVFTNQNGGIIDDLIVTKVSSNFLYVVSNASRKQIDKGIIWEAVDEFKKNNKSVDVVFFEPSERALLAVQGPKAVEAVQYLCPIKLDQLYFMTSTTAEIAGVPDCRITRCGYTGEDGVEISIPAGQASMIAEMLIAESKINVKLAGLGVRDSLRIEAGMCLYGNDIDETTTPIEAGLTWLVAKRRRNAADFPGADIILKQIAEGVKRRRVGLKMEYGPPARHDVTIFHDDQEIGKVTSGCPGPSAECNVAMGYVKEEFKKIGTKVELMVRGKRYPAEITKMPFVKTNYYVNK